MAVTPIRQQTKKSGGLLGTILGAAAAAGTLIFTGDPAKAGQAFDTGKGLGGAIDPEKEVRAGQVGAPQESTQPSDAARIGQAGSAAGGIFSLAKPATDVAGNKDGGGKPVVEQEPNAMKRAQERRKRRSQPQPQFEFV